MFQHKVLSKRFARKEDEVSQRAVSDVTERGLRGLYTGHLVLLEH
jgi:hypothetical protein